MVFQCGPEWLLVVSHCGRHFPQLSCNLSTVLRDRGRVFLSVALVVNGSIEAVESSPDLHGSSTIAGIRGFAFFAYTARLLLPLPRV